jgi:hypothetical protein
MGRAIGPPWQAKHKLAAAAALAAERENDHGSDGLSLLATHHLRKR